MDWSSIETDLLAQTEAHWSNGGQLKLRDKENVPLPPPAPLNKLAENAHGDFGLNYVMQELRDLREHCNRQEEKLSVYEKLLISHGTLSETVNNDLLSRIMHLEKVNEPESIIGIDSDNNRFIKEKYDAMIYDRLGKLEEMTGTLEKRLGDDNVVGDLGKLVNASLDHIKSLGTITEKSKKKSDQAVALLEAMFQALASLQQGGEEGDEVLSSLEFALSMNGESQQHHIKHMIMDSLQRVVDKSIRAQVGAAIECLGDLFNPQLRGVEASLLSKVEGVELNMKLAFEAVHERLQHDEKRMSENHAKLSQAESNALAGAASAKALKESVSELGEEVRGTRSALKDQKDILDMLMMRRPGGGIVNEGEVVALREDLKDLQCALDKMAEQQHLTRSDVDDMRFELTQTIEKNHMREGNLKVRIDDVRDDAREGTTKLKTQVQVLIEQQVGELTRKFNKLEGKFDKYDRKGFTPAQQDVELSTISNTQAVEERCKELSEGLDGVRQSIANVTFDLDDLREAFKILEKKDVNSAARIVPNDADDQLKGRVLRVEESVATLREAMDALQDEIVMLAHPPDVTAIRTGGVISHLDRNQIVEEESVIADKKTKIPIGTKTEAPAKLSRQVQREQRMGDNHDSIPNEGDVETENFPEVSPNQQGTSSDAKVAKTSMTIDLSSSDSSFSASSDEDSDDEDIIGTKPKTSPDQTATPPPSDVLAEQLRIKADFERKEALKRVQSKGMVTSPHKVAGPPVSAAVPPVSASSTEPIVSGSLLGAGGGRRFKNSGALTTTSLGSDAPLFETLAASAPAGVTFEPSKPGTTNDSVPKEHVPSEAPNRKDTIQCSHCLRRIAKANITAHSKSCELRTELCRNGCGSKILVLKMEQHLLTCPKK